MRILLVEDERSLADGLVKALRQLGYAVDWLADGKIADELLKTEPFNLIILDLGLPRLGGLEVLRKLRHRGVRTPVLMLTARDDLQSRIAGLDAGADDYLCKPFELLELEARARALLRRDSSAGAAVISAGTLRFDSASRCATVDGQLLDLPRREFCLLEILLHRLGQVVSKEQIAAQLFDFDDEAGPNAIELYIHRLRKKLSPAGVQIRTVRGLGYLLDS